MEKIKVKLLDGGMGTMLQANGLKPGEIPEVFGLEHPSVVTSIHKQYIESGSEIIYANTFGANRKKLKRSKYSVDEIIHAAISQAKSAGNALVALDIGPIGEMLEPNGYLSFEEAYDIFKEMIVAGVSAGADLVVFETMSDLLEVKAGILAAKENSDLKVFVTMSFEGDHRTFTGCSIASFALLCDRLGVDAAGINCSLGPDEIYPIAKEFSQYCNVDLMIKANAGLPDPLTNQYGLDAYSFAQKMMQFCDLPIRYVGGCCGTTPAFIKQLKKAQLSGTNTYASMQTYLTTPTQVVCVDGVRVVGERINPTGNKRMKNALLEHNLDEIIAIAMEQIEAGAQILDVNVGVPGIDEKEMMVEVVKELQSVIDVPLQIDSTKPEVLEAALRIYHGIANINSINGEEEVMQSILPIAKKYGANVIGLTLDRGGIQESAQARLEIAKKIKDRAADYGIGKHRVLIDCLTLTVSAQQKGAMQTLYALSKVREMGMHTVLGVSNISFGLPQRIILNQTFLTMAMYAGLTLPIINPNQKAMMDAVRSYRVLSMEDLDSAQYIEAYANVASIPTNTSSSHQLTIEEAIQKGLKEESRQLCITLLKDHEPLDIVNEYLIPALDRVGKLFEAKKLYLPQLLNAASASQMAFEEIRKYLLKSGASTISKGKVILATVFGDVHDIGKNIVKVVLQNYGYQVIDLGKDVPVQKVVDTAIQEDVKLVGLSALMTTTLAAMEDTVKALHDSGHVCKIVVGGAVVSEEYAKSIHADYYAKDALETAKIAKEVLG